MPTPRFCTSLNNRSLTLGPAPRSARPSPNARHVGQRLGNRHQFACTMLSSRTRRLTSEYDAGPLRASRSIRALSAMVPPGRRISSCPRNRLAAMRGRHQLSSDRSSRCRSPGRRADGGAHRTPSTRTSPRSGAMTPPNMVISVDLPAPFSPTTHGPAAAQVEVDAAQRMDAAEAFLDAGHGEDGGRS